MKYLLQRRYWAFRNERTNIVYIEAEFTTFGLQISDSERGIIRLNKRAQQKLFGLLKERHRNKMI